MRNSKMKKVVSALLVSAMSLTMCLGASFTVGATESSTVPTSQEVAITKKLNIAAGITTPDATFKFDFVQQPVAGSTPLIESGEKDEASIESVTLSYSATDTDTEGAEDAVIVKQTSDVLAGATFPHAGIYQFLVTEDQDTFTADASKGESIVFSQDQYILRVYVVNDDSETGENDDQLRVENATVEKLPEGSDGTSDGTAGTKVNGAPDTVDTDKENQTVTTPENGEPDDVNTAIDKDLSDAELENKFVFENTFKKNGGSVPTPDPDDPTPIIPVPDPDDDDPTDDVINAALVVSKTVTGTMGDRNQAFNFTMNIVLPSTAVTDADKTIVAYKYTKDATGANYINPEAVQLQDGVNEFTLTHDQAVIVSQMPAGTTYTLVEAATVHYLPTVSLVANEVTSTTSADSGASLAVPSTLVGEKTNSAAVTNAFQDTEITPTGIMINNLPMIMVILVAIGGFVLILAGKRRKAAR